MIDLKILKQLIKMMSDHDLTEIDLHDGEEKVKLKRGRGEAVQYVTPAVAPAAPAAVEGPAAASGDAAGGSAKAPDEDAGMIKVTSPMVGTFYSAPSPDSKPFVSVGGQVDPESVVCIIEAMKVFNEIKAECSGTMHRMCVSDGQAVEFGQTLFLIKP